MRIGFVIGGVAIAMMVFALVQWWPDEPPAEPEPKQVVPVPVPVSAPPPTPAPPPQIVVDPAPEPQIPEVVLPPLDASDEFVRETLADIAVPPTWISRDELVRRFAVVVDNAARGHYPHRQLGFLAPGGRFKIIERGEELYVDPANHRRYDTYVETLEAVDPESLADLVTLFAPLVDQALRELGNGESLRGQLSAAIDQVLAVPIRRGEVRLVQPKVFYEYADPRLEKLLPLQKQVLRMGPDNTQRMQDYLLRLRRALGKDEV